MSILFVPIYLRYLGIEVYGIIGIFASVQAVLMLLDGGLSPTINREMARLSAFPERGQETRDLVRTLEIPYWLLALLVGGIGLGLSPLIAHYWVRTDGIAPEVVVQALMLMSVGFAFQWTLNFYSSGLIGLQRQRLLNVINAVFATLRSIGSVVTLAYFSQTIQAFLLWQAIVSILNTITTILAFRYCLPSAPSKGHFRSELLKQIWRYAAGMTGIVLVSLIAGQMDKILLSRLLTLENFGYYTLASTIAGTIIGMIVAAVGTAYFPRYSQLVALEETEALKQIYHRSCQIMSVLLLPVTIVIAFFSKEILVLWTKNEEISANAHILLSLVVIGVSLNGLVTLPYYVQLAYGYTKLALWTNAVAIFLLVPLMFFFVQRFGAIGGAVSYVTLNLLYVLVEMPIMHRIMLRGELRRWYLEDIGLPLVASLGIAALWKFLPVEVSNPFLVLLKLAVVSITVFAAAAVMTPFTRNWALALLGRKRLNMREVF